MHKTSLPFTLFLLAIVSFFVGGVQAGQIATVRVGVCLSLTGEFRQSGLKALAGIRMRVEEHNEGAAPAGYRIVLTVRDDHSHAEAAVQIVEDLGGKEHVPVIIGPLSTNLMLGMREAAHRVRVVLLSPSVTSPKIGRDRDWAVRLLFDDEFQGVALARYLYHGEGVRRVASLVNRRLAYANSVNHAFKTVFEREGGTMVREEFYDWVANEEQDYDFLPALERIRAAKPDMVLLPNNSTDVTAIIYQSLESSLKTRFCGGDTWLHEWILEAAGNNVEGAVYVSGVDYDADTPQMRHYLDRYDRSNDPDAKPSSVLGYDAASLVIEALKKGFDAESVRDALYEIRNFPLAIGDITIDPVRGSEKTAYIRRIDKRNNAFVSTKIAEIKP